MEPPLEELEALLGCEFADRDLLVRALTHRSHPSGDHNERLEFLGDAVLGLLAGEALLETFPDASEGRLTKLKAQLVSSRALESVARAIELGRWLRLGKAEEAAGGREKRGLLVDATEALLGAVYLDGGLDAARKTVARAVVTPEKIRAAEENLAVDNSKSTLQELLQSHGQALPRYRVEEEMGPPHDRRFRIVLEIGPNFHYEGEGASKRQAEQRAAARALESRTEWLGALSAR